MKRARAITVTDLRTRKERLFMWITKARVQAIRERRRGIQLWLPF